MQGVWEYTREQRQEGKSEYRRAGIQREYTIGARLLTAIVRTCGHHCKQRHRRSCEPPDVRRRQERREQIVFRRCSGRKRCRWVG